jgi:ribonuclease VapC
LIVVDSSALIAILLKEPDHIDYVKAIAANEDVVLAAPNALEAIMVAVVKLGDAGRQKIEALLAETGTRTVGMDPDQLTIAIAAFMQFGRGRDHPARLNYGDCMAYALAKQMDAPLLYKGGDFAKTDIRSVL